MIEPPQQSVETTASLQEASIKPKKMYSNSSRNANKENSGHKGTSALAAPLRPMKESQQLFNNVLNVEQLSRSSTTQPFDYDEMGLIKIKPRPTNTSSNTKDIAEIKPKSDHGFCQPVLRPTHVQLSESSSKVKNGSLPELITPLVPSIAERRSQKLATKGMRTEEMSP